MIIHISFCRTVHIVTCAAPLPRLHDRCGLNWLPDKLLLLIFSYMNYDDIDACSKVCRRWKYLASVDDLWMLKCHEYGRSITYIMTNNELSQSTSCSYHGKYRCCL